MRCAFTKTIVEPVWRAAGLGHGEGVVEAEGHEGRSENHKQQFHPVVGSQPKPSKQRGVCFEMFPDIHRREIEVAFNAAGPPSTAGQPCDGALAIVNRTLQRCAQAAPYILGGGSSPRGLCRRRRSWRGTSMASGPLLAELRRSGCVSCPAGCGARDRKPVSPWWTSAGPMPLRKPS